MLVLAHRGYHVKAPQNTLAAFAAAAELDVDGIETDVRVSRDGAALLVHDRVTPRGRLVSELTRSEIEVDFEHAVPLLGEALEAFPDLLWNVEIKQSEMLGEVLRVLAAYQSIRRLLVTSFRHDVACACAQALDVDCGLLAAHRPLEVSSLLAHCTAAPRLRTIVWDYNVIDAGVLAEVEAAGWRNYVYGPATLAEHARCTQFPVVGVITDFPQRARI